jgi:hypothetical protein
MSEIRKFPEQAERVETGPIQFGEDWPGTFIRGDNCFGYAMALRATIDGNAGVFDRVFLLSLLEVLCSSNLNPRLKELLKTGGGQGQNAHPELQNKVNPKGN